MSIIYVKDSNDETQNIINIMKENTDKKYLYITPYKDCLDTVIKELNLKKSARLGVAEKSQRIIVGMYDELKLINNILVRNLFDRTFIIDGVIEQIDKEKLTEKRIKDIDYLIDKDGCIKFVDGIHTGIVNKVLTLAKIGVCRVVGMEIYVFHFPIEIIDRCKETYIYTTLFYSSLVQMFLDDRKVTYEINACRNYFPHLKKIRLIEDESLYDKKITLNEDWFNNNSNKALNDKMLKIFPRFFRNYPKVSTDLVWTSFGDIVGGFFGYEAPITSRLHTDYIDKNKFLLGRKYVAYMKEDALPQDFIRFVRHCNTKYVRKYAITKMMRFFYRTSLKDGEYIYCYIPSKYMREQLAELQEYEKII